MEASIVLIELLISSDGGLIFFSILNSKTVWSQQTTDNNDSVANIYQARFDVHKEKVQFVNVVREAFCRAL